MWKTSFEACAFQISRHRPQGNAVIISGFLFTLIPDSVIFPVVMHCGLNNPHSSCPS